MHRGQGRASTVGIHRRQAAIGLAVLLWLIAWTAQGRVNPQDVPNENRRCMQCHAQSRMADLPPDQRLAMVVGPLPTTDTPTRPGLFVPDQALQPLSHRAIACADCHADAAKLPHNADLQPVSCDNSCHTPQASGYLQGTHAKAAAAGNPLAPTCASCHGSHNILPKSDPDSRIHPVNIIKVCADCHQKQVGNLPDGKPAAAHVAAYLDSVHGRAVEGGLAVAATCADCHGAHKVLPSADADSQVNRHHVAETCGQCHVGVERVYLKSVHGQELARGSDKAPVCSDCHAAHSITRADTPEFMLDIVNECGSCHNQRKGGRSLYETYRNSYHGQVAALGYTRAARCSDCHGAHDVRRLNDPAGKLSPENRLDTCRSCHPDAGPKFASFQPHADHRDGHRYPLLHAVWLYFMLVIGGTFAFFGVHTILWFVRAIKQRTKNGHHNHHATPSPAIERFNRLDRINHGLVVVTFFGLTLTGMPLLFADHAWAGVVAGFFGGVNGAGVVHRILAVILIANFVLHGYSVWQRKKKAGTLRQWLLGPNSLLPRLQDVKDAMGMFRWFFAGGQKPRLDRWTYWEKFDYWAEIFGTAVIGGTGLILWFPEFFSWYIPGWFFNVSTIIHGYEALLAVCFIFTIHFFNAHLRPEKFPTDDVMFTGRLPESEFKDERPVEYDRLVASGQLEQLRRPPVDPWKRRAAIAGGVMAMLVGTAMVVLIVLAGLGLI